MADGIEKGPVLPKEDQKVLDRILFDAVGEYAYDRIDLALRKGADIDAQHENGYTPLMLAVSKGSDYLVGRALKGGPDLFVRDQWNRTAFEIAKTVGDSTARGKIMDALLNALPDRIRKNAATNEEAISIAAAESEAAKKKPARFDMPEPATFKPKTKGFNP